MMTEGQQDSAEDKMLKILLRAAMVAPALAVLLPLAAQAANPEFCRGYAEAAENQVRAALSNPACAPGARGARWTPERRVHFDWCLTQPVPAVEGERGARTAYLRGCRG